MESVRHLVAPAVARIVRPAPLSIEKVLFAWRVSVGPAMARVTHVALAHDGVLRVEADDSRWVREIVREEQTILERLRDLLGQDQVRQIDVTCLAGPKRKGRQPPAPTA